MNNRMMYVVWDWVGERGELVVKGGLREFKGWGDDSDVRRIGYVEDIGSMNEGS